MRLLAMSLGTSFILTLISNERKSLSFQRITVIDEKLHLTSTCTRKLLLLVRRLKESSCGLSL